LTALGWRSSCRATTCRLMADDDDHVLLAAVVDG